VISCCDDSSIPAQKIFKLPAKVSMDSESDDSNIPVQKDFKLSSERCKDKDFKGENTPTIVVGQLLFEHLVFLVTRHSSKFQIAHVVFLLFGGHSPFLNLSNSSQLCNIKKNHSSNFRAFSVGPSTSPSQQSPLSFCFSFSGLNAYSIESGDSGEQLTHGHQPIISIQNLLLSSLVKCTLGCIALRDLLTMSHI